MFLPYLIFHQNAAWVEFQSLTTGDYFIHLYSGIDIMFVDVESVCFVNTLNWCPIVAKSLPVNVTKLGQYC